jgi:hypothetical protein
MTRSVLRLKPDAAEKLSKLLDETQTPSALTPAALQRWLSAMERLRRLTSPQILEASGPDWSNSATGGPRGYLTLSTSEWPSDAAVCSLSDILGRGSLPRRFFLSPRACLGILRRGAARAKDLPARLLLALSAVARLAATDGTAPSSPADEVPD